MGQGAAEFCRVSLSFAQPAPAKAERRTNPPIHTRISRISAKPPTIHPDSQIADGIDQCQYLQAQRMRLAQAAKTDGFTQAQNGALAGVGQIWRISYFGSSR